MQIVTKLSHNDTDELVWLVVTHVYLKKQNSICFRREFVCLQKYPKTKNIILNYSIIIAMGMMQMWYSGGISLQLHWMPLDRSSYFHILSETNGDQGWMYDKVVLFELADRLCQYFLTATVTVNAKANSQHVDQVSTVVKGDSMQKEGEMLLHLPSSGFCRMLPSQNSLGIGSSPIEVKNSSAFSNIFFWFQPWLSISPVTLRLGLPG